MSFLDSILKKQVIGLDIGVSGIKALELSAEKTPRVLAYNRVPLAWDTISTEGEVKDRKGLVAALKALFAVGNFSSRNVAVSAFGRSIITKRITVPAMSEEELQHQLYFEAEQYLPFNTDEVNLDFAILGPNSQRLENQPQMDVLLVAAKKEAVADLKNLVNESGLVPVLIDTQAFALGNIFEYNYENIIKGQGSSAVAIIDFGAGSTKVTVIEGSQTAYSREIQYGGTGCSKEISEKMGISLAEAELLKINSPTEELVLPVIQDYSSALVDEISRSLDYFMSQSQDASISAIFTCGGGVLLQGLMTQLNEKMPAPVELLNPLKHIVGSGQKIEAQILSEVACLGSVAAGLSLRRPGDN